MRLLLIFFFIMISEVAAVTRVLVTQPSEQTGYFIEVLKQALKVTEYEYGPYRVSSAQLVDSRGDVAIFSGTSINNDMTLIELPIYRGLGGVKVPIILSRNEERIRRELSNASIKVLQTTAKKGFQKYRVLLQTGFNVSPVAGEAELVDSLLTGKASYILKNAAQVTEIVKTMRKRGHDVVPLSGHIVYYPQPFYIHVTKSRPRLLERIKKGLEIMEFSGDLVISHHAYYSDRLSFEELQDSNKTVVRNPFFVTRDKMFRLENVLTLDR